MSCPLLYAYALIQAPGGGSAAPQVVVQAAQSAAPAYDRIEVMLTAVAVIVAALGVMFTAQGLERIDQGRQRSC